MRKACWWSSFIPGGGPFVFTAQDHTGFIDAFYRIAQDRANKIVILTGAGGEFIPSIDFASFGNVADPAVWSLGMLKVFRLSSARGCNLHDVEAPELTRRNTRIHFMQPPGEGSWLRTLIRRSIRS